MPSQGRGVRGQASCEILEGDALDRLADLEPTSVQCVVTSPPYWGLRDYGVAGQMGLEKTPEEFIVGMVGVFREVRRVLRDDGTLWLNIGDSYASDDKWGGTTGGKHVKALHGGQIGRSKRFTGLKSKDLVGIPWMLAFALRADGWYLRQDIIWSKPNPMPESVHDRCTKAHEYLFLLSKSRRYYYNAQAIAEPVAHSVDSPRNLWNTKDYFVPGQRPQKRISRVAGWASSGNHTAVAHNRSLGAKGEAADAKEVRSARSAKFGRGAGWRDDLEASRDTRNRRTIWTIATEPFPEAHFATFPTELVRPCILAGCPEGGLVLDPFNGSGTTGLVATRLQRNYIGIELNPEYVAMSRRRIADDAPLFNNPTIHRCQETGS